MRVWETWLWKKDQVTQKQQTSTWTQKIEKLVAVQVVWLFQYSFFLFCWQGKESKDQNAEIGRYQSHNVSISVNQNLWKA